MRSPLLGRELSKWHGHISVLAVILMIVTSLYCLPLPAEETAVKGNVLGGEDLRSSQPQIGGLFVSPPYRTDWGSCLRFLIRLSSKRFCRSKTNQHGMCLSAECCSAPPFCAAGACMTSLSSGSFSELDKVMMRRGPQCAMNHQASICSHHHIRYSHETATSPSLYVHPPCTIMKFERQPMRRFAPRLNEPYGILKGHTEGTEHERGIGNAS